MIVTEQAAGLLQVGLNIFGEPRLVRAYPDGSCEKLCTCGIWHDYGPGAMPMGLKRLRLPQPEDWHALWEEATPLMWSALEAVCPPEYRQQFQRLKVSGA